MDITRALWTSCATWGSLSFMKCYTFPVEHLWSTYHALHHTRCSSGHFQHFHSLLNRPQDYSTKGQLLACFYLWVCLFVLQCKCLYFIYPHEFSRLQLHPWYWNTFLCSLKSSGKNLRIFCSYSQSLQFNFHRFTRYPSFLSGQSIMEWEVCLTLLPMTSTRNWTQDLLTLSSMPYLLDHMLPLTLMMIRSRLLWDITIPLLPRMYLHSMLIAEYNTWICFENWRKIFTKQSCK